MKQEPEPSGQPVRLGITPVGLGCMSMFVIIAAAMAGTWLIKLIMMFFRWLGL